MFPKNTSICIVVNNVLSGLGALLKAQVANYNSTFKPHNTIASAFTLKDLKDMVSELENYNATEPSEEITAIRFTKLVVDASELDPRESGTTATIVGVPTYENGRSVFDVLPHGTAGATPVNTPPMYISKAPCPHYCG